MPCIAFVSAASEPPFNTDDALSIAPLERRGHTVLPHVWDAGALPRDTAAVVIRACWDYHRRSTEFRAWLDALERDDVVVINAVSVLRWNLDKFYLRGLADAGVPIPPTVFVPRGPAPSLVSLLAEHGLTQAVVKPAVSLSADRTWRCDIDTAAAQQDDFTALLKGGGALVQAFVPEVQTDGELSLVFFDGRFSHAVRKRPRSGDFRVQAEHGGTRESMTPSESIVAQAVECLARAPGSPSYARVDGIVLGGVFVLMELELIDPVLFLAYAPGAAEMFAAAIDAALR